MLNKSNIDGKSVMKNSKKILKIGQTVMKNKSHK